MIIVINILETVPKGLEEKDHTNQSIVDISQNTEKSPGDMRTLAVTQTPVKMIRNTIVDMTGWER